MNTRINTARLLAVSRISNHSKGTIEATGKKGRDYSRPSKPLQSFAPLDESETRPYMSLASPSPHP